MEFREANHEHGCFFKVSTMKRLMRLIKWSLRRQLKPLQLHSAASEYSLYHFLNLIVNDILTAVTFLNIQELL